MTYNELPLINSSPGDERAIEGFKQMVKWQPAWSRAIARAWIDEEYKRTLIADPHTGFRQIGYDLPKHFNFVVVDFMELEAQNCAFVQIVRDGANGYVAKLVNSSEEPAPECSDPPIRWSVERWRRFKNGWPENVCLGNTVIVVIPPRPDDLEFVAAAVVDYQASGSIYPFTCCCC